jgi:hypothetical protein
MKTIFTLLSAIAFMGFAMPATTMAATKKKTDDSSTTTTDDSKKDAKKGYPIIGYLASISETELVLKGSKEKPEGRKYTINKDTKITKDGKPATVKDAPSAGSKVTGYAVKSGEKAGNGDVLHSLNLSPEDKKKEGDKPAATTTTTTKTDSTKTDTKKKKKTDSSTNN